MALIAAASCNTQEGGKGMSGEPVSVRLALCVGGNVSTKADVSVISELKDTPEFSGMSDIMIIPFGVKREVESGDEALQNVIPRIAIGTNGLVEGSNSHIFGRDYVFPVPRRTASFLVYGKSAGDSDTQKTEIERKHINGSLIADGIDNGQVEAIRFRPDAMLTSSATPAEATTIASALNGIVFGDPFQITARYGEDKAQSTLVSVPWDGTIGDPNLLDCYESITAAGALIPGSGVNVEAMLTNLYRSVYSYNVINPFQYELEKNGGIYPAYKENGDPLTYADIYNGVKSVILARFTQLVSDGVISIYGQLTANPSVHFVSDAVASYPEQYGLPSGAAVVRWTPSGYVVPLENGHDGIAPISAYCYPPPLYYYTDSEILTTNDDTVPEKDNTGRTWEQILTDYKDGGVVYSTTRGVAIKNPLHYAVGMLKASVKSYSNYLQDNDGLDYTMVEVSGDQFPLTGVIVGRQYPQSFDFTPVYDTDAASKQYYLYDDRISGIYLATRSYEETPEYFRTVVLQTPDNKDTYFCLEFRNDSGKSFYGAEGRVLPGHKFYLIGKLVVPTQAGYEPRVFTRDFITTVNCTITSLQNAHSAVPDMGIPQLTVGVETQVNWIMSDPVTMIFE